MTVNRIKLVTISVQILFWSLIILLGPVVSVFNGGVSLLELPVRILKSVLNNLIFIVFFYLNYLILAPKLIKQRKRRLFILSNLILILLWYAYTMFVLIRKGDLLTLAQYISPSAAAIGVLFGDILIFSIFIALAVGLKYPEDYYELREKTAVQAQKASEAELVWLKNQLNPHFLFNTLNNINSLIQIDPEKAQECISQLSDILRYALYETNVEKVPLSKELAFMDSYIDLMALRCNDLTTVTKDFALPQKDPQVAPLIFISLIENAFKHGVNARQASFVNVRLSQEGPDLVFVCRNSVFEKSGTKDMIGSGIGLENTRKRLELIYPGKYEFTSENDGEEYVSIIRLIGIC